MIYKGEQIGIPSLEIIQEVINTFKNREYKLSSTKILRAIEQNKDNNYNKDLRNVIAGYNSYPCKYSVYPNELYEEFDDLKQYSELLQYEEWKNYREKVFSIRGKLCEWNGCNRNENLHIHHEKYVITKRNGKRKLPWQYPIEEVRVYCKEHHDEAHEVKYINKV